MHVNVHGPVDYAIAAAKANGAEVTALVDSDADGETALKMGAARFAHFDGAPDADITLERHVHQTSYKAGAIAGVTEILDLSAEQVQVRRRIDNTEQVIAGYGPVVLMCHASVAAPNPLVPPVSIAPRQRNPQRLTGAVEEIASSVVDIIRSAAPTPNLTPPPGYAIERETHHPGPPPIEHARLVIGGGKGVIDPTVPAPADAPNPTRWRLQHAFETQLHPLAAQFGAAVVGTRAVVDMGVDVAQVGQSGPSIAPVVYLALGISGAVQHMQGVGHSGHIIAVNTDPTAPIFRQTDTIISYSVSGLMNELLRFGIAMANNDR